MVWPAPIIASLSRFGRYAWGASASFRAGRTEILRVSSLHGRRKQGRCVKTSDRQSGPQVGELEGENGVGREFGAHPGPAVRSELPPESYMRQELSS